MDKNNDAKKNPVFELNFAIHTKTDYAEEKLKDKLHSDFEEDVKPITQHITEEE